MNAASGSMKAWAQSAVGAWDRFWFTPAQPHALALIRILGGAMLLYTHAVWTIELTAFLGPQSWLTSEVVGVMNRGPDGRNFAWSYWNWVQSPAGVWIAHLAALARLLPERDPHEDIYEMLHATLEDFDDPRGAGLVFRSLAGGFLVQSRDSTVVEETQLKIVTRRRPTARELADLEFAFKVAKHVKSNAIVYARDGATVGIGAGQMSRVDSARIAAWKSQEAAKAAGEEAPLAKGSVVASDAFFPFADGLLAVADAGATAVIQPGGSMRDAEVIQAADEAGLAMVFTGVRHFRH